MGEGFGVPPAPPQTPHVPPSAHPRQEPRESTGQTAPTTDNITKRELLNTLQ